jgi:hypothetical protein
MIIVHIGKLSHRAAWFADHGVFDEAPGWGLRMFQPVVDVDPSWKGKCRVAATGGIRSSLSFLERFRHADSYNRIGFA